MKIKLSIIILNWNGQNILDRCLKSISRQTRMPFEIIVVDNGSFDHSVDVIKRYKFVKLLKLDKNHGFAEGNNRGIEVSKGNYIFLLNNDTVLENNCIENIIENIKKNKNIDTFSPVLLLDDKETIDTYGISINKFGLSHDVKTKKNIYKISGLCGGAAIFKRKTLEKLKDKNGYLDKRFFIYFEDADLAWRFLNKGVKFKLINEAKVYHLHGETTKKTPKPFLYFFIRNRILSFYKNNKRNKVINNIIFFIINCIVLFKYFIKSNFKVALDATIAGYKREIINPKKIFKIYG